MKKKMKVWKKVVIIIVSVILALIIALGVTVYAIWHNEFSTIASFEVLRAADDDHEDGAVYKMEVSGSYYFDDFIAQGGVSSDSELITYITNNITKGLIDMGISETEIGCSSFTAATSSGDRIFARNYDFAKTNTCIVFTDADSSKGRHATISTVDLQFLSIDPDAGVTGLMDKITCLAVPYVPLDGMNDAGVSCGIYMSYQGETTVATNQTTDAPDITSTTMLRLILDYADSVEEAVELVEKYDLHDSANTSYHYMVADASGKSAILEWVPETGATDTTDNDGTNRVLKVVYNDDDDNIGEAEASADNYQWITNFIIQPDYYESNDDKPGYDRYMYIYEQLSATDGVIEDEEAAMDILAGVGRRSWNGGDGITVHSAVYNLTDLTVTWVSNENYGKEDATFTFSL